MRYLLIDTCNDRSVIACFEQSQLLFVHYLPIGKDHSKFLMPQLEAALQTLPFSFTELNFIAVAVGPGSYTGIRVGVSVAQALAYSWNIPLIGFPSLIGYVLTEENIPFLSIIDAKLGGVYFQKGCLHKQGYSWISPPKVSSLELFVSTLEPCTYFVTPKASPIAEKIRGIDPNKEYIWQEKNPDVRAIAEYVQKAHQEGLSQPPGRLNLLYLREWS